jgi:zinc and cadmium transporter
MHHAWLFIAAALLLDGLAALAGGLLSERWLHRRQAALVGFAAGALLASAFLDVLPESIEGLGSQALIWAFAAFVSLTIVEWRMGPHHRGGEGAPARMLPVALLSSDSLHNIGDGAAVAAAFLSSFEAGLSVALAVIAHEIPQEVGDYALLRAGGMKRSRALLALAAVQLTSAVGAIGVVLLARYFHQITAAVLAITGGTFLYIAATDLLPEIHSGRTSAERRERMIGLLSGVALIGISSLLDPQR